MEPRAEIKIGWATDGSGSGMKFCKKLFWHGTMALHDKMRSAHDATLTISQLNT